MARNIVFIAPFALETTMRFVRAVARLDNVRLLGVVHTPPSGADQALYSDMVRVTNPLDPQDIVDACRVLASRHGALDRIVGILEHLQVPIAQARELLGVPGTGPATADLFRDKPRMKAALAEHGLPVARNRTITSMADGAAFAAEVGFPMVVKPPAGMGAKATFRVSSTHELAAAIRGLNVSAHNPLLAEELLAGREFSFETITINGEPRVHSISHYLPSCLDVLENPWIQWCCLLPRDISGPEYNGVTDFAFKTVRALGLEDGMTHMEWFQRPDDSFVIGEIAARPPGANITLMTGLAHDIDPYRAWARAVVDGELDAPWERKYAVGCAFLRGMGRGRVVRVTGVHAIYEAIGSLVAEANLPTLGAPKSDHYEGDGYIVVRHPDTTIVRAALKRIIETVKIVYG